jgi:hypothetical protein
MRRQSGAELAEPVPAGRRFSQMLLYGTMALIVVLLLSTLWLSPQPKVRLVGAGEGGQLPYHTAAEYQRTAEKLLAGSFGNRTKLGFNRLKLLDGLRKAYPEIAAADVHLPLVGQKPVIILTLRDAGLNIVQDGRIYIVDNQGTVVMLRAEPVKTIPTVTDQSGVPAQPGKQLLTAQQVNFISSAAAQLSAQKQAVSALLLPHDIANELHVRLDGLPYFVKFSMDGDGRVQVGTMLAMREYLEANHIQPIEYVDVRVEGRAYYK